MALTREEGGLCLREFDGLESQQWDISQGKLMNGELGVGVLEEDRGCRVLLCSPGEQAAKEACFGWELEPFP